MEELQDFYPLIYSKQPNEPIYIPLNIRDFWENNKQFWFSHSPITGWPLIGTMYDNCLGINMSMILHYDQLYRHPNPNIRQHNKQYAFRFATHLALKMLHNGQFDEASEWEKAFILLTLRHNNSLALKELALKKVLQMAESNPSPLLLRFLNATIWSVHELKHIRGYTPEKMEKILQKTDSETFQTLCQTPKIPDSDFNRTRTFKVLMDSFSEILKPYPKIAVSISGGVDSMIAAYITNEYCKANNKELILLHINYNNRDCCEQECDLLRDYANKLGVSLYIRKITEIKRIRNSNLRNLYEEITRKIRFSFYSAFNCPVILGHNLDDCFENVFQNLSKQIHFDNLFGMKSVSEEQGVTTLRPMLSIYKKDILQFADSSDIPHLCDSTPAWSRRGQMRDNLIPGIQTFDKNILPGLEQYIKHTIFLEKQWENSFNSWLKNIKTIDSNLNVPRDTFFETNNSVNFWIKLWYNCNISQDRPSNKSFENLIEMTKKPVTNGSRVCTVNSKFAVKIYNDRLIISQN
jgi:tRNA(Ile)-lysidine synthetase-like protein